MSHCISNIAHGFNCGDTMHIIMHIINAYHNIYINVYHDAHHNAFPRLKQWAMFIM